MPDTVPHAVEDRVDALPVPGADLTADRPQEHGEGRSLADDVYVDELAGDNTLVGTDIELTWWTFAGGRANAAMAGKLSRRLGVRASGDNFAVKFEPGFEPLKVERAVMGLGEGDAGGIVPTVSDPALDGLKFSDCLPRDLAVRVIQARLTDVPGAAATLGRPTPFVASV